MDEDKLLYREESYRIMGACFEVYTEKGNGFLEAVYRMYGKGIQTAGSGLWTIKKNRDYKSATKAIC